MSKTGAVGGVVRVSASPAPLGISWHSQTKTCNSFIEHRLSKSGAVGGALRASASPAPLGVRRGSPGVGRAGQAGRRGTGTSYILNTHIYYYKRKYSSWSAVTSHSDGTD